jgi:hypothetical protein
MGHQRRGGDQLTILAERTQFNPIISMKGPCFWRQVSTGIATSWKSMEAAQASGSDPIRDHLRRVRQ